MADENDIIYTTHGLDLVGILQRIADAIRGFFGAGDPLNGSGSFFDTLGYWWSIYSIFALAFSILLLIGFVYAKIRYGQLVEVENRQLAEAEMAWAHTYGDGAQKNNRWADIQAHITSENPNDWRLGIIEADIMLDEIMSNAGFVGASVGEKLKSADPSNFRTVQDAWDAHKVRNDIAHVGGDFVLTKRVAQETLVKYERVFREFGAI